MPGFVEALHPRGPGGKFRASLASRARKYRQAGAAKLAAFRLQESARVRTKLQQHDVETERLVADAGDKAGKVRAARDNRRKAIEDRSAARLDEARKRIRASVRYEHELGKLRGQPFDVQDRAWNRWRKRKAGERVRGNDALKAAIARAKANGPRKVDVHQDHLTGRTVSKRSKTGNPACSAAMSAWKLGRGTPEVHAMLAKCRAMAAGRRQAELSRAAGNEARAQHLEHRSKQGMTGKEREARAAALIVGRAATSGQGGAYARAELRRNPPVVAADRVEGLQRAIQSQKTDQQRHMTETGKIRPGHEKEAAANLASIREQQDRLRRAAALAKKHKFPVREAHPSLYDPPRSRAEVLAAQARNRGDSAEAARMEAKVARANKPAPAQAEAPKAASKPKPPTKKQAIEAQRQAEQQRADRRRELASRAMANAAKRYGQSEADIRQSTAEIVRDFRAGKPTYGMSYGGGGYGSKVTREDLGTPIYHEIRQKVGGTVSRARARAAQRRDKS